MKQRPKKYALTKREIIRRPREISVIFETGRFMPGRFFDLIYLVDTGRQVMFAVSKRIRTAVTRNLVKRRLREAYRLEKSVFQENLRLILIGHEKVLRAPFDELRQELRRMATRIS